VSAEIRIEPIGVVRSPVTQTEVDEGWGSVVSELVLAEPLAPGLSGLDTFSHAIVVFWMTHAFVPARDLVRRPRGREDMPQLGIFAQRGKQRPNPIGVSVVEVLEVAGRVVKVRGLDAIDGTPILDLKPYVPVFDRATGARVPEWMDQLMERYFS
jgi:tRNA-Thr(GGU) m(6)t(6)A37 methyltransferase TsaA